MLLTTGQYMGGGEGLVRSTGVTSHTCPLTGEPLGHISQYRGHIDQPPKSGLITLNGGIWNHLGTVVVRGIQVHMLCLIKNEPLGHISQYRGHIDQPPKSGLITLNGGIWNHLGKVVGWIQVHTLCLINGSILCHGDDNYCHLTQCIIFSTVKVQLCMFSFNML